MKDVTEFCNSFPARSQGKQPRGSCVEVLLVFLYSVLGLAGIFAPGLLTMAAVLPFWSALRGNRYAQAALRGVNASVVGIIAVQNRLLSVGV